MPAFPEGWNDSMKLKEKRLKGVEKMVRPKREAPPAEELRLLWEKHEGKINPIAKELRTSWAQARQWLIEAGIINSSAELIGMGQTPEPEPAEAVNQEPVQMPQEPAETSIPRKAATINQEFEDAFKPTEKYEPAGYCRGTITTADGETYPIGDWEPQDEEPIPYRVVEQYDLARIKLMLIRKLVEDHDMERDMPDHVILGVIGQIKDMEVSV